MSDEVFRKHYNFFSTVTNGKESIDNIRTEIAFNEVGPSLVEGSFFGDDEQGKKLGRIIVNMFPVSFRAMRSAENTSYSMEFKGKNIRVESFHTRNEKDELCHFECGDLEVLTNYRSGAENPGKLYVNFAIPNRDGLRKPTLPKEWLTDDNFKDYTDYLEYDTEIGPMRIVVSENVDHCTESSLKGKFEYDELVMSFDLEIGSDPIDGMVDKAELIVQDYLDIISMILQCRTNYYRTSVMVRDFNGIPISERQSFLETNQYEQRKRFIGYDWNMMDNLLKRSISLYTSHDDKPSLKEAIGLFLAGIHSDYAEAKLIWWQSAIESIVNTIRHNNQTTSNTCQCCGQSTTNIREKIIDVCNGLTVKLNDIYPSVIKTESDFTFPFIKYRNAIVHGRRGDIDYEDIIDETEREQMLLERLIVHWLGADAGEVPYLGRLWEGIKPF